MNLQRTRNEITIDLNQEEDAAGLFAFLTNNPSSVSPEVFARGQQIYGWLFRELDFLSTHFVAETEVKHKKRK